MALDHFVRHKWSRVRTDWNFNVLFGGQPQVAAYADEFSEALRHPGLYPPVPGEWLHATILRVGFLKDFTREEMLAVAKGLEPKLAELRLPEFLLGQWWVWGGNPCVHFTPDSPFIELFRMVVREVTATVGSSRAPKPPWFTPHITLAYCKTYVDQVGLLRQLQSVRADAVPVRATALSLIEQRVINHYYTWEVVQGIPIGQAS